MPSANIEFSKKLSKKIEQFMLDNNLKNKRKTIVIILEKYFKKGRLIR